MFRQAETVSSVADGIVYSLPGAALRQVESFGLVEKVEEIVLRVRRAGVLFIAAVASLLILSILTHAIGLLLWLIALPLAVFGSFLSMLWPTRRRSKRKLKGPAPAHAFAGSRAWLVRRRSEIPCASRAAFDLVIDRVRRLESLACAEDDPLILSEGQRLIAQHLPRLVQSFLALPPHDRSAHRTDALTAGLVAIAQELAELADRLLKSRTDRFETERQFIDMRYSHGNGLAGNS